MLNSRGVIDNARVEVERCRRNLDKGGPLGFWYDRLERGAKQLEAAACILRMQMVAIECRLRQPGRRGEGSGSELVEIDLKRD